MRINVIWDWFGNEAESSVVWNKVCSGLTPDLFDHRTTLAQKKKNKEEKHYTSKHWQNTIFSSSITTARLCD